MEEELLGIFGLVRSKDVTGLAVLHGVSGEVLCAGYGWEGYTEATWRGWVKDVTGLAALPGVHGEVPCAGGSEVGCAKAT